jgi:hypothetical protein
LSLDEGRVMAYGSFGDVVRGLDRSAPRSGGRALQTTAPSPLADLPRKARRRRFNEHVGIFETEILSQDGEPLQTVEAGVPAFVRIMFEVATEGALIKCVAVLASDASDSRVRLVHREGFEVRRPGAYEARTEIPWPLLEEGHYAVQVNVIAFVEDRPYAAFQKRACSFDFVGSADWRDFDWPELQDIEETEPGVRKPFVHWTVSRLQEKKGESGEAPVEQESRT